MSDWAINKASVAVLIGAPTSPAVLGRVAQALREARAEGMREAAKVIEDYGLRFWQEQDLPLRQGSAMLQSLAHLIKKHSGEDSKA